ncbi:MAG: hypothetical protein MUO40_00740 [Anaerolineaceae bacterium]|nr:hypothetical protein [Anaerolineaceae bacterium]
MNIRIWKTALLFLIMLSLVGCKPTSVKPAESEVPPAPTMEIQNTEAPSVTEIDILEIPLSEPLNVAEAEISGMDWYGDKLVLLPQFPDRFKEEGLGSLFYIDQADIIAYIKNPDGNPVSVNRIAFDQSGIQNSLKGFEGYEAIAFYEESFFITVETKPGVSMKGFVFKGEVKDNLSLMTILPETFQEIRPQANYPNASDEAILVFNERVYTFYEDYGKNKNNNPEVHIYDLDLNPVSTISMPNIEYRFTDASQIDSQGNFWAINYFYPGDTHLLPSSDPIAEKYGEGRTHLLLEPVERLVQFQLSDTGIILLDQEPIQFTLLPNDEARNWEGLVALVDYGFLVATDKFPHTILGFCESLR